MENPVRTSGWREAVDLPHWGLHDIPAKMDSGARSSCIDARDMEVIEGEEHGEVRFTFPAPSGPVQRQEPILDWRLVRDSGGHAALRPVIAVRMGVAGDSWDDETTLLDRSDMRHRILVGRRILSGRFLVDPARSFVLTEAPQGATAATGAPAPSTASD